MRRSLPVLFFALALALRGDARGPPAPRSSQAAPAPATLGAPAQTPGRGRGTGTPATGRGRGAETPAPTLDVAAIERGLGTPGQIIGDVYKISFPQSDLSVKVGDVALKPEFALAGWAAFKLLPTGNQAVVDGDLVLLESEVSPVLSAFQQHEFDVTAVHNSLPNASPTVMDVHFWAEGGAGELAASLKDVLSKTKTPMAAAAPAASAGELQVDKIRMPSGSRRGRGDPRRAVAVAAARRIDSDAGRHAAAEHGDGDDDRCSIRGRREYRGDGRLRRDRGRSEPRDAHAASARH